MVHTILFASAFVALIATVSAIPMPGGSVVDIDGGDYIGTDTIDLDYLLADAISAQNVEVKNVVQDVDVLSDDDDDFRWGELGRDMFNGGNGNGGNGGGRPLNRPDRPNNGGGSNGGNGGNNHGAGCGCGCKKDGGLLGGLLKRHEAKGRGAKVANKAHMHKGKAMKANKE